MKIDINAKTDMLKSNKIIDIECIPQDYRSHRQNEIIFREKRLYAKKLLDDFQRDICNRRYAKRIQMLRETARDCEN